MKLTVKMLVCSALVLCITIRASHRKISPKQKNWRNFPIEKDCQDYHKQCSSDANCHNCQNGTLKCRQSNDAKKKGIKLFYCKPKHEDDPHKKREHPSQGSNGFKSHFQRVLVENIDVDTQKDDLWQLIIDDFMHRKRDGVMQSIRDDVMQSKQENVMRLIGGDVMRSKQGDVINSKQNDVIQSIQDDIIKLKRDDVMYSQKDDDISSKQNNHITGDTAMKHRPNDLPTKRGDIPRTALDKMIADFRKDFLGFLEYEYFILHHKELVLRILVDMMLRSDFGTEDASDGRKMLDLFKFIRKRRSAA